MEYKPELPLNERLDRSSNEVKAPDCIRSMGTPLTRAEFELMQELLEYLTY